MLRWSVVVLLLALPLSARAEHYGAELSFGAQSVPEYALVGFQPRALVFHDLARWVQLYGRLGYTFAVDDEDAGDAWALEAAGGFDLLGDADDPATLGRSTFPGILKGLRLGVGVQHAAYEVTSDSAAAGEYRLETAFVEVQPYLTVGPVSAGLEFRYHAALGSSAPDGVEVGGGVAVAVSLAAKF